MLSPPSWPNTSVNSTRPTPTPSPRTTRTSPRVSPPSRSAPTNSHEQLEGTGVAITEPVPAYLLAELGLDNLTPEAFSEAIEEGADVPPLALDETLALFADGRVALLAYNAQTASPETERVREAAEAAGIPVVDFTETLPDGADYLSWMTDNVEAVAGALS